MREWIQQHLYWRAYLNIRCSHLNIILSEDDTNYYIIWSQISNVHPIKKVLVDSIYVVNPCAEPAISWFFLSPSSPRQSPVCRIWYNTLHYIFGSAASSSRLIETYPFANPRNQLAHEVTPSVILRKCISKSFFLLSWLPESVFF